MRGTLVLMVLALALTVGVAHAQAPNPAVDAALAEGRRLYDLQEWDKAIAKFKEAYALREDAAALFNIAQSYRLKGDCAQAAGFYKTFKRKFPKEKNVDKFISDMETCAKSSTTTPTSSTDPTKTNPTDPTKTDPTKMNPTDPTKPDPTTDPTKTTPTEPTKTTPIKTDPTTNPTGATGTSGTEPVDRGGGGLRIASYVSMGAGAAGLAVGVIFAFKARSAANEAEALDMGDVWRPSIQERGVRNQRTSTVGFVAGGLLAAGGVVMFVLSRPKSDEHNGVSLAPSTDGAQLVWSGSF